MISRIHPNDPNGPTGLMAWKTAAFRSAPGVPCYCQPSRAVMLDPGFSTPGLAIAVSPDGSLGAAQILLPGDVALFDKPVSKFWAWNAGAGAFRAFPGVANFGNYAVQTGWVGFLTSPDPALFGSARADKGGRWPSGIIFGAFISTGVWIGSANPPENNGCLPGTGLGGAIVLPHATGLRISVYALHFGGVNYAMIQPPADFAVTLRPWIAAMAKKTVGIVDGPQAIGSNPLDESADLASAPVPMWVPDGARDLQFTDGVCVREMPISVPGGFLTFTVPQLAGTGVDGFDYVVEAF